MNARKRIAARGWLNLGPAASRLLNLAVFAALCAVILVHRSTTGELTSRADGPGGMFPAEAAASPSVIKRNNPFLKED